MVVHETEQQTVGVSISTVASVMRGADGRSAYQVAVDNGYTGTQAEWLASLKGEKGEAYTTSAEFTALASQVHSDAASVKQTVDDFEDSVDDALAVSLGAIEEATAQASSDINSAKASATSEIAGIKSEATSYIDGKVDAFNTSANRKLEDIVTSANAATQAKNDAVSAKNDAVTAKQQAEQAVAGVNQVNASVAKSGNTATITMTSKTGTVTTATVTDGTNGTDGEDGKPGVYVQDTQPTESDAKVWLKENGAQTVKLLTESDIPNVPVKSVSAGGIELVPDGNGNVNIPIASASEYGVAKLVTSNGITKDGNNALYIVQSSDSEITGRSTARKAITPSNLNTAVKASLTDANRITGLTSSEMDNACEVLGAVRDNKYELVEEITLTEDVSSVQRMYNADGSEYNYKSIYVLVTFPIDTLQKTFLCSVNSNSVVFVANATHTSKERMIMFKCEVEHGRLFTVASRSGADGLQYIPDAGYGGVRFQGNGYLQMNSINKINMSISGSTFKSGTSFKIYGVSA